MVNVETEVIIDEDTPSKMVVTSPNLKKSEAGEVEHKPTDVGHEEKAASSEVKEVKSRHRQAPVSKDETSKKRDSEPPKTDVQVSELVSTTTTTTKTTTAADDRKESKGEDAKETKTVITTTVTTTAVTPATTVTTIKESGHDTATSETMTSTPTSASATTTTLAKGKKSKAEIIDSDENNSQIKTREEGVVSIPTGDGKRLDYTPT